MSTSRRRGYDKQRETRPRGGYSEECKGCSLCVEACPPKVLRLADRLSRYGYHPAEYLGAGCTGCGICFYVCPEPGAIAVLRRALAA